MTERFDMDTLLLRYAAGALDPAESFMAAALLSLNAEARKKLAAFENLCGQLMQEETPAPLSARCLEEVLIRIEAAPAPAKPCRRSPLPPEAVLPAALHALFEEYWNDVSRDRLHLVSVRPHQPAPPAHVEATLILSGGYGAHHAGEIVIVETVHQAGPEGCLVLTLTEAPVPFQDRLNRVLRLLLGSTRWAG